MVVNLINKKEKQELECKLRYNGLRLKDIANKFAVSVPFVCMVLNGKRKGDKIIEYIEKLPPKIIKYD